MTGLAGIGPDARTALLERPHARRADRGRDGVRRQGAADRVARRSSRRRCRASAWARDLWRASEREPARRPATAGSAPCRSTARTCTSARCRSTTTPASRSASSRWCTISRFEEQRRGTDPAHPAVRVRDADRGGVAADGDRRRACRGAAGCADVRRLLRGDQRAAAEATARPEFSPIAQDVRELISRISDDERAGPRGRWTPDRLREILRSELVRREGHHRREPRAVHPRVCHQAGGERRRNRSGEPRRRRRRRGDRTRARQRR